VVGFGVKEMLGERASGLFVEICFIDCVSETR
jgi:hypothetical protein